MLRLYETMLTIRAFEERAWAAALTGEGLPIHPSTGHEAVAVGVCSLLSPRDRVVSNHRPFGHFIAKGGSIPELMAELFGKSTGVCRGLGGEMILSEPKIGFMISSMIVGACLTIATGVSFASHMKKSTDITVCFFGDAASTNGAFHEALTMASLYRLPILFVCENNAYCTNSPDVEYMPTEMVSHRASGHGFPTSAVDGSDVLAVREAARRAIWTIRHVGGPYLLEALVSRIGPHKQILVDSRPPEVARFARMRDPIIRFASSLRAEGVLDAAEERAIHKRVSRLVKDAVEFARHSPSLTVEKAWSYTYVNPDGDRAD
jgi:pyruvate dehydrogenase E1 component alpha subunit